MLRKVKKAILQSPVVLAAPLQTRLENRPSTVTLLSPKIYKPNKGQRFAKYLLVGFFALFFIGGLRSAQWNLAFISAFMLLLVGFIVWIVQLRAKMVWKVTWHKASVEVEDGRYGSAQHWSEPFAAFTGLTQEVGRHSATATNRLGRAVYGLILAHPDPFKSILLYTSNQPITENQAIITYYQNHLGQTFLAN